MTEGEEGISHPPGEPHHLWIDRSVSGAIDPFSENAREADVLFDIHDSVLGKTKHEDRGRAAKYPAVGRARLRTARGLAVMGEAKYGNGLAIIAIHAARPTRHDGGINVLLPNMRLGSAHVRGHRQSVPLLVTSRRDPR